MAARQELIRIIFEVLSAILLKDAAISDAVICIPCLRRASPVVAST